MNAKYAGLKSNLRKIDTDAPTDKELGEIPELPYEFFKEGQLYRNGKPVERHERERRPTVIPRQKK